MPDPIAPAPARPRASHSPLLPLSIAGWLAAALLSGAQASEASPWAKAAQSEARLIEGGGSGRDAVAGLEIRLQPRFITYWRDPGDAGVPPSFSFAGSTNLKAATVRYPLPRKLDEAGAVAFGYEGDVTFPILVVPVDPSRPVGLSVALDYAACHEICLPAHADLHLVLDGRPSAEAGRVDEALAAVPRPATVGAPGSPGILTVAPDGTAGDLAVTAAAAGSGATLFVEAPEGWAYEAGPSRAEGDVTVFPVKRLDHPKDAARPPGPLVLTLGTAAGAIEVPVALDGPAATP